MKKLSLVVVLALFAVPAHAQGLGINLGGGTGVNVGLGAGGLGVGVGVGGVANVGAGLGGGGLTTSVGVGSGGGLVNAGVGVGGGGVSVNAGVGGGLVGVNAGVGGGGVTAGVSVGGAGAGVGTGGSAGGGSGGVSGGGSAGSPTVAMVAPTTSAAGFGGSAPGLAASSGGFQLPASLRPNDHRRADGRHFIRASLTGVGVVPTTPLDVAIDRQAVEAVAGTPMETVASCRAAILNAAAAYNPVYATTASAGRPRATAGGMVAPIQTKLVYERRGGYEVRQSRVNCRLSADGIVAALS